ncbi:MAG: hypothetical protein L0229_21905 [Blastocatellia bacterium]|nr:hypothetical protein [Blastocatellia bacterium]
MKTVPLLIMVVLLFGSEALAQENEVSIQFGATAGNSNLFEQIPQFFNVDTGAAFTFQASYARRIFDARLAAIYFDVPLTIIPNTTFDTPVGSFPRDFSSFFFTPGLKLKLLPGAKYSPYAVAGAGFARLNPSDIRIDGQPLTTGDSEVYGAYTIGGGLDIKVASFLSLRGEIRDIRTGSPQLSINLFEDREHYIVTTTGIVVRF